MITGKPYDYLKFLAQILLPALGALYFGLAGIWDLPSAEQVVGTIVVVDTFLGVLLGISTQVYNNSGNKYAGTINVIETPDKKVFSLDLDSTPESIEAKKEVTFKVSPPV